MPDLLNGKYFLKGIGSEDRELGLGGDNVVIHRLRELYANRGALHREILATEAG
jgi:hypothetical protein